MQILLINHYAGSPELGMEFRPYYLARAWVRLGHQVTIAAASFSHLRAHAPATHGPFTEQEIDGVRYVWLRTPAYKGNGPGRFINILVFLVRIVQYRRLLCRSLMDGVVIASSTYPLDIFPARMIARMTHSRLVFEVHDLWPLSVIEVGGFRRWHPFILLLQRAEDFGYRHADRVVSLLPHAIAHMRDRGLNPEKFRHIPNGFAAEEWEGDGAPLPLEHRKTIQELKRERRFLVGYAGGHGLANDLDTAVSAASSLEGRQMSLVLVGEGTEKKRLVTRALSEGVANVVFLPPITKRAVPTFLRAMDALYIGWRKNPLYRFGISPNKLIDYLMSGRPIIHAVEAGNDPVRDAACGISIPPENPAGLAAAILSLAASPPQVRESMGRNGMNYARANFEYTLLAQRFLDAVR